MKSPRSLKEALEGILPANLQEFLPRSFDVVGSIAIIDLPDELSKFEKEVAVALMRVQKHVSTVLAKDKAHGGEFRTQNLQFIAGEDTRETLVKENGYELLVDVEKVYYSERLSTERLRVARLVSPGERVLVLFSGAAPYVLALAKHSVAKEIVGVEKNPVGHEYAVRNIARNKVKNAKVYCADAADLSFLKGQQFDRIIMPHPSAVFDFLSEALTVAAGECSLHLYSFAADDAAPELIARAREIADRSGYVLQRAQAVAAGRNKPRSVRWCLDLFLKKAV